MKFNFKLICMWILLLVFLVITIIFITFISIPRDFISKKVAAGNIKQLQNGSRKWEIPKNGVIPDEKTALDVGMKILLRNYGNGALVRKPFKIFLIDDYWYIAAGFKKGSYSDDVKIILSKKDGRVICVSRKASINK